MPDDRFPFTPFPDGWFRVGYSAELKPGQVQPVTAFGQELVLFRTEAGQAVLLDAYCPHLGAHLGHGGVVKGECIECPFHAWQIGTDGKPASIPYSNNIPQRAQTHRWELREVNEHIFAWYHGAGQPPSWEIPQLPELQSDEWTPLVRRTWRVRSRNQELAENSVDTAHFRYLHGTLNLPPGTARTEGPLFISTAEQDMGTPRGPVKGGLVVTEYGFGFTTVRFTGLVDTINVVSTTSVDDEYVEVHFNFTLRKSGNISTDKGLGKAIVREVSRQVEQDIPIWENKAFLRTPLICDGDGPIPLFRKWARQFYSAPTG